jgi:hypothetical protein
MLSLTTTDGEQSSLKSRSVDKKGAAGLSSARRTNEADHGVAKKQPTLGGRD